MFSFPVAPIFLAPLAASPLDRLLDPNLGFHHKGPVPLIALALLVILIVVAILIILSLVFGRKKRLRLLLGQVDELRSVLAESQKRIRLIDDHAMSYMNAMETDISRLYLLVKRIVNATDIFLAEVESLIATEDYGALIDAEELFDSPLPSYENAFTQVQDALEFPEIYPAEIGERLDEMFQIVGKEISRVSHQAKQLGQGSRRKRKNTMTNLMDAGIRYVNRARRKLSTSFKSPFIDTTQGQPKDRE